MEISSIKLPRVTNKIWVRLKCTLLYGTIIILTDLGSKPHPSHVEVVNLESLSVPQLKSYIRWYSKKIGDIKLLF